MRYWLMKSEPETFSIDDLAAKPGKRAGWDGVRNYQARNFMRDEMRIGDLAFFYHSNAEPPGIAGIVEIVKESHPDPTQFDKKSDYYDPKATAEKPIWYMVEVKLQEKLPRLIALDELRALEKELKGFALLARGSRLSVMPVAPEHWQRILKLKRAR